MLKILKWLMFLLGFIWCSPVTLLSLMFYQGPLVIWGWFGQKQVEKIIWRWRTDFAIVWDIANVSRFYKVMSGFFGNVVGANVTVTDIPNEDSDPWWLEAFIHELRHVVQNYVLGVFFFPLYILFSAFIWLFLKDKHAHIDNPFERDARKKAGQPVEIPREQWYEGPNDRNPWW